MISHGQKLALSARSAVSTRLPGLLVVAIVAMAAVALASFIGVAAVPVALLLGISLGFLQTDVSLAPGVGFAAEQGLRAGVVMLAPQIVLSASDALGVVVLAAAAAQVLVMLALGYLAARMFGFAPRLGLIAGAAAGVCGASAAGAVWAATGARTEDAPALGGAILCAGLFGTVFVFALPPVAAWLGLDALEAGVLAGLIVPDVAQAVAAGHAHSDDAGVAATVAKMARVACLPAVVLAAAIIAGPGRPAPVDWLRRTGVFPLTFMALLAISLAGLLPDFVAAGMQILAPVLLIIGMSATGLRLHLGGLRDGGAKTALLVAGLGALSLVWASGAIIGGVLP